MIVKPVEAEFVLNIQVDQHCARNTDGQSEEIDRGKQFLPAEIPDKQA